MSPAKGIEAIRRVNPDLVFLDIEMPAMNGFELLNQFRDISFSVILQQAMISMLLRPFDSAHWIIC